MTNEDLKNKIDHLEVLLKECKDELEQGEKETDIDYSTWWPENGGGYYFIDNDGNIEYGASYGEYAIIHARNSISGILATKDHAETFKKIDDRYWQLMEGVSLDWGDFDVKKYFLRYDHSAIDIFDVYVRSSQAQGIKYMTKEIAEKLYKDFTQAELKLWILGGARR